MDANKQTKMWFETHGYAGGAEGNKFARSAPTTAAARSTPIADDAAARSATIADDAAARSAPIADDAAARSAPIADDAAARSASIADDAAARSAPIADDAAARSAPIADNAAERKTRVFVASSWRNEDHGHVVETLRDRGFSVYDYRNPHTHELFLPCSAEPADLNLLSYQCAAHNLEAIIRADAVVCVLPAGKSTHFELGFALALSTPLFLWRHDPLPFEVYYSLMFNFADIFEYGFSHKARWEHNGQFPSALEGARDEGQLIMPAIEEANT